MAVSDIDIANLAFDKIGTQPIVSFTDVNTRAQLANRNYAMLRDKLQRTTRWNFTRTYARLAASVAVPPFEYLYAYPFPDDLLRLEIASSSLGGGYPQGVSMPGVSTGDFNNSRNQDYRIVGKEIWSNLPPPLSIIYARRVTDPNMFDSAFVDAFASYLAQEWCMQLTDSGPKKQMLMQEYRQSLLEAISSKSVELPPEIIPDDSWMLSRIGGG